jgi:hypothetical protein
VTAWVTGAAILVQSGAYTDADAATPSDTAWAAQCASAISEGFDARLRGAWGDDGLDPPAPLPPPTPLPAELATAALNAGVELYKRREAPFGPTGYVDIQGAAIRLARDYLEAVAPIIARYATVGIA